MPEKQSIGKQAPEKPGLKQREEQLKMLLRRLDDEIKEFSRVLDEMDKKKDVLDKHVLESGRQPVPISFGPHSKDAVDLHQELRQHVLSLNKTKNFINEKLKAVLKEEALLENLDRSFGKNVTIKQSESDGFEIVFKDKETQKSFEQLQKGKLGLEEIRKAVQRILG